MSLSQLQTNAPAIEHELDAVKSPYDAPKADRAAHGDAATAKRDNMVGHKWTRHHHLVHHFSDSDYMLNWYVIL